MEEEDCLEELFGAGNTPSTTGVIQQSISTVRNGRLCSLKSPGESGMTVVKLETYPLQTVASLDKNTWWKHANIPKHLLIQKLISGTDVFSLHGWVRYIFKDLVMSLWNAKTTDGGFLTDGGFFTTSVPNVDMLNTESSSNYRNKLTGNSYTLSAFLNKASKHLHAIAIVYKKSYSFLYKNMNSEMQELIKSNLVDLIVYERKAPYDKWKYSRNYCRMDGSDDSSRNSHCCCRCRHQRPNCIKKRRTTCAS